MCADTSVLTRARTRHVGVCAACFVHAWVRVFVCVFMFVCVYVVSVVYKCVSWPDVYMCVCVHVLLCVRVCVWVQVFR